MVSPIVEGFSLSHAAILDGATGAEEVDGDIYGVRSASLELSTDSYDNTGDDATLSTWFWFNFATVTVQGGYLPFPTIALLSESQVTSTGTGDDVTFELPLWEDGMLNTRTRPMYIRVPSKDKDGNLRNLDFVLYKVQFQPFTFDGPNYKDGLLLNYTGRALMSDKDETGQPVVSPVTGQPSRAVGRLINRPVGVPWAP